MPKKATLVFFFFKQLLRNKHYLLSIIKDNWYLWNVGNQLNQHQIRPEVGEMLKN